MSRAGSGYVPCRFGASFFPRVRFLDPACDFQGDIEGIGGLVAGNPRLRALARAMQERLEFDAERFAQTFASFNE